MTHRTPTAPPCEGLRGVDEGAVATLAVAHESVANRERRGLQPGMDVELGEDAVDMRTHRVRTDVQATTDGPAVQPRGEQSQYLSLPVGQLLGEQGLLRNSPGLGAEMRENDVPVRCGLEGVDERIDRRVLAHVPVEVEPRRLEVEAAVVHGGEGHDPRLGVRRADGRTHVEAGHVGKIQIHQDDVGTEAPRQGDPVFSGERVANDVDAAHPQRSPDGFGEQPMVVDDQDANRWPPSRSSTGISRQKSAPELDDFSVNDPPWASATRRATKRPRPLLARRERAARPRMNGSKIAVRSATGTPGPSSLTEIVAPVSSMASDTVTGFDAGEYVKAFRSRFEMAARNSSASAVSHSCGGHSIATRPVGTSSCEDVTASCVNRTRSTSRHRRGETPADQRSSGSTSSASPRSSSRVRSSKTRPFPFA